ncbi:MAG: hypothetical protein L0332_33700 [Chloroflexi bacterium]|nr:hypothetical protein [Chloroflexota bacterium]MCI0578773.1 hypothetical protein [Chloroflexota bacterium]MCI0648730.1 hypothetical protein [Chloroflexota bacterium]MCI0731658.1 hypothetical protein [Chloroflexota bacterium]
MHRHNDTNPGGYGHNTATANIYVAYLYRLTFTHQDTCTAGDAPARRHGVGTPLTHAGYRDATSFITGHAS